ncbi:MAG: 30S ribosomal protein S19 [Candidatus Thermoplasmatota archaeon]|nr:30S ribosomal protein S19 [Candidatus Thermoplasmatota archaeon]
MRKLRRKKIEVKKAEFRFCGLTEEELRVLSIEELLPLLTSRMRRTMNRGLTKLQNKLLNDVNTTEKGNAIKTHCRNMIILPSFIGHRLDVYNGHEFQRVDIEPHMVGHYLGEFALTRKKVKHTGPGVGATRSSKYMPLK